MSHIIWIAPKALFTVVIKSLVPLPLPWRHLWTTHRSFYCHILVEWPFNILTVHHRRLCSFILSPLPKAWTQHSSTFFAAETFSPILLLLPQLFFNVDAKYVVVIVVLVLIIFVVLLKLFQFIQTVSQSNWVLAKKWIRNMIAYWQLSETRYPFMYAFFSIAFHLGSSFGCHRKKCIYSQTS